MFQVTLFVKIRQYLLIQIDNLRQATCIFLQDDSSKFTVNGVKYPNKIFLTIALSAFQWNSQNNFVHTNAPTQLYPNTITKVGTK